MNTQNQEINLLSDDELDAVAGGVKNCETMAFAAFLISRSNLRRSKCSHLI